MSVFAETHSDIQIIAIKGRVDSSNADDLENAFQNQFKAGFFKIIVDLSETIFLSSMGIRAIIFAKKESNRRSGDVVLAAPAENMQEVIDIAGLNHIFTIYDSVEEARAGFESAE
jgi:anti-anti-sigma factor